MALSTTITSSRDQDAVTVSSNNNNHGAGGGSNSGLRSCLKRHGDLPKVKLPRKSIRFGPDQVQLIVPLSDHDLWHCKQSLVDRWRSESRNIRTDRSAMDYIQAYQMAYDQFSAAAVACCHNNNNRTAPWVSNRITGRLVWGVNRGHRSLERFDPRENGRKQRIDRVRHAVVHAYQVGRQPHRRNKDDEDDHHQHRLREQYQRLSLMARQWARFVASIDAVAARVDPMTASPMMVVNPNDNSDARSSTAIPQQRHELVEQQHTPPALQNMSSARKTSLPDTSISFQPSIPNNHPMEQQQQQPGDRILVVRRRILERSKLLKRPGLQALIPWTSAPPQERVIPATAVQPLT